MAATDRWRVGHIDRDTMYYDEFREGRWRRLKLDGEMLMGRAHHVIYFGSRTEWKQYPAWAQGRRDEIIDRVKTTLRIPDYEYAGEAVLTEADRLTLLEAAGGLSGNRCRWVDCPEQALNGKEICVFHAVGLDMWR